MADESIPSLFDVQYLAVEDQGEGNVSGRKKSSAPSQNHSKGGKFVPSSVQKEKKVIARDPLDVLWDEFKYSCDHNGRVNGELAVKLLVTHIPRAPSQKRALEQSMESTVLYSFEDLQSRIDLINDEWEDRSKAAQSTTEMTSQASQSQSISQVAGQPAQRTVGIFEFLRMKRKHADTQHVTVRCMDTSHWGPRRTLWSSAVVLMVFSALLIITCVSLLSVQVSTKAEHRTLSSVHGTIVRIVDAFDTLFVEQYGVLMKEQAEILARYVEKTTNYYREEEKGLFLQRALRKQGTSQFFAAKIVRNAESLDAVRKAALRVWTSESYNSSLLSGSQLKNFLSLHWNVPAIVTQKEVSLKNFLNHQRVLGMAQSCNTAPFVAELSALEKVAVCCWRNVSEIMSDIKQSVSTLHSSRVARLNPNSSLSIESLWRRYLLGQTSTAFAEEESSSHSLLPGVGTSADWIALVSFDPLDILSFQERKRFPVVVTTLQETRNYLEWVELVQATFIDTVDYLNWNFVRSTELVLGYVSPRTGQLNSQVTSFRFFDGCYEDCERFPPSAANAVRVFEDRGSGWSITPDYRPEPVVGAYSWIAEDLNMTFLVERDVLEIRNQGFGHLTNIVEGANQGTSGSTEIELFHFRNAPPMPYFFPTDQCPAASDCRYLEDTGELLFLYGCQHCLRVTAGTIDETHVERVNKFKKARICGEVEGTSGCRRTFSAEQSPVYVRALQMRDVSATSSPQYEGTMYDYANMQVYYRSGFANNYSLGVVLKVDVDEIMQPLLVNIAIGIVVGILLMLVGIGFLLLLSQRALSNLEKSIESRLSEIKREREVIDRSVEDMFPDFVCTKVLRGDSVIAEGPQHVGVTMVSISDYPDIVRNMKALEVHQLNCYMMNMINITAKEFHVTKLHILGDLFVAVAFNARDTSSPGVEASSMKNEHVAVRSVKFGVGLMELCAPEIYRHFPKNAQLEYLAQVFSNYEVNQMFDVPSIAIASHLGPVRMGHVDYGTLPKFDCYGPPFSICSRLITSCPRNHFMVSGHIKDAVSSRDLRRCYIFSKSKKVITRQFGEIVTHYLRAASQPLPIGIVEQFGIRERLHEFPYTPEEQVGLGYAAPTATQVLRQRRKSATSK